MAKDQLLNTALRMATSDDGRRDRGDASMMQDKRIQYDESSMEESRNHDEHDIFI